MKTSRPIDRLKKEEEEEGEGEEDQTTVLRTTYVPPLLLHTCAKR